MAWGAEHAPKSNRRAALRNMESARPGRGGFVLMLHRVRWLPRPPPSLERSSTLARTIGAPPCASGDGESFRLMAYNVRMVCCVASV